MMTKEDIISKAASTIFGKPLVTNVYRSVIVEAIINAALPAEWKWCSADYFEYDFVHPDGTRLEVKQSAMKQTWQTVGTPRPQWDIAERKTVWIDNKRVHAPGRNADIYVLGLHEVTDDTADHREPEQWRFFVVPTFSLPLASKKIGLGPARRLANPVDVVGLAYAVETARRQAY
ncbi:hypothetical protein [Devosia neptuniae]|uniref:hypothetical protein n=1 Tax=Devosia neptuniae TaxID=191302 RepID=UPI0022B038E3|nr:hypothetical protein [Devosia neptuniae]MCZ4346447.1 hypothetical protein [Devosia neptuniae]